MSTTTASASPERYRLPPGITPRHYTLVLEPDLDAARFDGSVTIDVDVAAATNEIVLNAIELDLTSASVIVGARRIPADVRLDAELERATLTTSTPVPEGSARVEIAFSGVLNDKLHGFYRSTFTDQDGAEAVIATTQFEATHARRAFPCWDEPSLKASFGVTLVVAEDLFAVSNAAEVTSEPTGDGRRRVRFADTMVMSTYLVAFVVGPLEASEPVDVDGVALRIVHPTGQGHLTAFALDAGAFALRFFTDYYGIGYPGDKLDLVAVPDFAFGAMENLGCVTFREVLLLVDPDAVTQPELQRVTDVIAHELAHMWFGDLVTMKWWNGLWLNEAFATFMEMLATDAFRPQWQRWVDFGLSRTEAFEVDSLQSTRPIEFPVVSPADAEGMFDILTYEKGAAVVRMLEQYLGAEAFRTGIRSYLAEHAYANTETTDLWDALENTSGQPTRRIMDSWIFQGGYPLVSVEPVANGSGVILLQERFSYHDRRDSAAWVIPVIVAVVSADGTRVEQRVLLEDEPVTVSVPADRTLVLVNGGGHGFYRVRYAPRLLAALTAGAQDHLAPVERYAVADDAHAALLAGRMSADQYLGFVAGNTDERDLSVWQRLIGGLGSLSRLLDGDALGAFEARVRDLLGPVLAELGLAPHEGEDDRRRELRGALLRALGVLGADPDVIARADDLHRRHAAGEPVDPPLAAAAVGILATHGDAARFDEFASLFAAADTPQEEQRYLRALAEFRIDDLADRAFAMTLDGTIRTQDAPFVLLGLLANRVQGPRAWEFVKANWDRLNELLPSNSISRLLGGIRMLDRPELSRDIHAFFTDHEVPQGARTIAQHLERLDVNVALRAREADRFAASLT